MESLIYDTRINKLQQAMKAENIDICLLFDRENLIYLGGIEQTECMAIVVPQKGSPVGVTMWLDLEFTKQNSAIKDIRPYTFPGQSLVSVVCKVIKEMGYNDPVIGFERYFVSFGVFNQLREEFDVKKFVDISLIIYKLRAIKTKEEIELIRKASVAVCAGMKAAIKAVKPGIKELDIAAEAEYASMKAGSQGTPFRPQIVSGARTLITHPFASEKKIENGEILLIHIGAKCGGYIAKMCRTVALGSIPDEQKNIYEVLKKAQAVAIDKLRPGVTSNEVCTAAANVVEQAGYNKNFLSVIGYGVGLRQSEFYPLIAINNNTVIEKNMVVDVLLPSIYKKAVGGPRITDTILITESKAEILTDFSKDLIEI